MSWLLSRQFFQVVDHRARHRDRAFKVGAALIDFERVEHRVDVWKHELQNQSLLFQAVDPLVGLGKNLLSGQVRLAGHQDFQIDARWHVDVQANFGNLLAELLEILKLRRLTECWRQRCLSVGSLRSRDHCEVLFLGEVRQQIVVLGLVLAVDHALHRRWLGHDDVTVVAEEKCSPLWVRADVIAHVLVSLRRKLLPNLVDPFAAIRLFQSQNHDAILNSAAVAATHPRHSGHPARQPHHGIARHRASRLSGLRRIGIDLDRGEDMFHLGDREAKRLLQFIEALLRLRILNH